jgi:hypothetical protein
MGSGPLLMEYKKDTITMMVILEHLAKNITQIT